MPLALHEVAIRLPYRPPYEWDAMLRFLTPRTIPGVECVAGDTYTRTFDIDGRHGLVAVRPGRGHALRAVIRTPRPSAVPTIVARLERLFDLAADPGTIRAHFAPHDVIGPLVSARPGLRVPGAWDGFELAMRAVLGQQITVTAAIVLAGKLVAMCGEPLVGVGEVPDALTHVFPQPDRVARRDLSVLGMPRARAKALSLIAAAVVADPDIFRGGRGLDRAIADLRELSGIGDWTAHYIAMRALREPDAFPAADVGLMRAMASADGRRPTARELLAHAERWRPWRAYAAQHLWASL